MEQNLTDSSISETKSEVGNAPEPNPVQKSGPDGEFSPASNPQEKDSEVDTGLTQARENRLNPIERSGFGTEKRKTSPSSETSTEAAKTHSCQTDTYFSSRRNSTEPAEGTDLKEAVTSDEEPQQFSLLHPEQSSPVLPQRKQSRSRSQLRGKRAPTVEIPRTPVHLLADLPLFGDWTKGVDEQDSGGTGEESKTRSD